MFCPLVCKLRTGKCSSFKGQQCHCLARRGQNTYLWRGPFRVWPICKTHPPLQLPIAHVGPWVAGRGKRRCAARQATHSADALSEGHSVVPEGAWAVAGQLWRSAGIRAFYRGLSAQMLRTVPQAREQLAARDSSISARDARRLFERDSLSVVLLRMPNNTQSRFLVGVGWMDVRMPSSVAPQIPEHRTSPPRSGVGGRGGQVGARLEWELRTLRAGMTGGARACSAGRASGDAATLGWRHAGGRDRCAEFRARFGRVVAASWKTSALGGGCAWRRGPRLPAAAGWRCAPAEAAFQSVLRLVGGGLAAPPRRRGPGWGWGPAPWRKNHVLRLGAPGSSFCARCGRRAEAPKTLQRHPFGAIGRWPSQMESAARSEFYDSTPALGPLPRHSPGSALGDGRAGTGWRGGWVGGVGVRARAQLARDLGEPSNPKPASSNTWNPTMPIHKKPRAIRVI